MKKFNICLHFSAICERTIEAETEDKAIELAKDDVYASDWNNLGCPELETLDVEEVEA